MTSPKLDLRLNAVRPDLADARLEGRVEAARFVTASLAQVVWPLAPMRLGPGPGYALANEVLLGEQVRVFETSVQAGQPWAWVQLVRDDYVGYVPAQALSNDLVEPTHRISALATWAYPEPDIKAPPAFHLSLGASLTARRLHDRFVETSTGLFVVTRHTIERGRHARDFVAVAERFLGTPYLWGGRSRLGLDCSGLVQLALEAAGLSAPRDSDMQQVALGGAVLIPDDLEGLARGDLVFWPGHVGIMTDEVMLLHANAHHMAVAAEPLASAAERSQRAGLAIGAIRRLPAAASPA